MYAAIPYRSEGYARTGYFIPGRDGMGGWSLPGSSSAVVAAGAAAAPRGMFYVFNIKNKELYFWARNGSPWLATGSYFGKTELRGQISFYNRSRGPKLN